MIMRFLLFAFGLLCLPSTCALVGVVGAFSSPNADAYTTTWRKSSKTRLLARRRPVIVAGAAGSSAAVAQAALGADLALSAREFVQDANNSVRESGAVSSVVVVQNAVDGEYPSLEQYEDAIRQFDDVDTKPILHVILEGAAAARPLFAEYYERCCIPWHRAHCAETGSRNGKGTARGCAEVWLHAPRNCGRIRRS